MQNEMQHNVFICYRGSKGGEVGELLYNNLKKSPYVVPFFAPKDVKKGEDFKKILPSVLMGVKVFIMILTKDFFLDCNKDDDIVRYEFECAFANENILFFPITFPDFDYFKEDLSTFSKEEIERFKHKSAVGYSGVYDFNIENQILPFILNQIQGSTAIEGLFQRRGGKYTGGQEKHEKEYLKTQAELLQEYDKSVYHDLVLKCKNILDIGCNDGVNTMTRYSSYGNIEKIVGIDKLQSCIDSANQKYEKSNARFYCVDLEDAGFEDRLLEIMEEQNISSFDFVSVTMVLLHLVNPFNLLKILKRHMSKGGYIFIRDVDDDLNFSYPDNEKIFERLSSIIRYCDTYGYRQSGKEIYSHLCSCGFNNIKIAKQGLDTSQMDYDQKEAFFHVYYGYVPFALKKMKEKTPDNEIIAKDYNWAVQIMDRAEILFKENSFIFSLGYIVYVAQR